MLDYEQRGKAEAEDQLELWPEEPRPKTGQYVIMAVVAALALLLLFAPMAKATEVTITKAMICDTTDQLRELLDDIAEHDNKLSRPIDGCGPLRVSPRLIAMFGGVPVKITAMEPYETKTARIAVAKFDFTISPYGTKLGVQYGWIAYEMKAPSLPV